MSHQHSYWTPQYRTLSYDLHAPVSPPNSSSEWSKFPPALMHLHRPLNHPPQLLIILFNPLSLLQATGTSPSWCCVAKCCMAREVELSDPAQGSFQEGFTSWEKEIVSPFGQHLQVQGLGVNAGELNTNCTHQVPECPPLPYYRPTQVPSRK